MAIPLNDWRSFSMVAQLEVQRDEETTLGGNTSYYCMVYDSIWNVRNKFMFDGVIPRWEDIIENIKIKAGVVNYSIQVIVYRWHSLKEVI